MNLNQEPPKLIENNMRQYLSSSLKVSHNNRVSAYLTTLNIGIFVGFIVVVSITLYLCRKTRKSPEEEQEKRIREQEYILSKIRFYQQHQQHINQSNITNLPMFEPKITV
jgi:beta-lactamase regulating signal transducer with metallopeptidase domain